MVSVSHLTKKYGEKAAVDDVSFSMERGHIYGLLGPNGAGKSTTMNMMTGFTGATSGTVTIDGFEIYQDAKKAKQRIGYLPEIPPLYPDMTVQEYLLFVAELKGIPSASRAEDVESVMGQAGVTENKGRLIRNLSKGFKQRVGFAEALLGSPELLILDEPTVGMDPRQVQEFRNCLLALKENHIILLSSHILSEVSEICDHIFIISAGRLILSEDADRIEDAFGSERTISVTGIGDPDAARMSVVDIPGVTDVETSPVDPANGKFLLTIRITGEEDLRPQISQRLVERHFAILEMKENEKSLEDVFLELTEGDQDNAGSL